MTFRGGVFRRLVGVGLVAAVAAAGVAQLLSRQAMTQAAYERLESESALLARLLPESAGESVYASLAEEWSERLQLRVTIIAGDGRVVADSTMREAGVPLLENHNDRPEVLQAREDGLGRARRLSESATVEYLYVARRVSTPEGVLLRVALPADAVVGPLGGISVTLVVLMIIVATLALVALASWLSARAARPLEKTIAAVQAIAAGDLQRELPAVASDDLTRLGQAVERVRAVLIGQVEGERRSQWLLDSIVSGMREGLLIVDADQRVLAANEALRRSLTVRIEPIGRLQSEVFRHPDVIRSIERALESGEEVRKRLDDRTATGRIFDLQVTPVTHRSKDRADAAVALFYDVSRLERLESVRQTFVADVSHELRTPLTSIKAAVETLLDDADLEPSRRGRFLHVIERHAKRMEALVNDLSDLSRIETGAIGLELREVDVAALVGKIVEDFAESAGSLGVRLRSEVPEGLKLRADPRRLEQMLVNLVDNAIKFNRENGSVTVTAGRDGEHTVITVEDTGLGIPSASAEKVFHRFFRVDEARSRESGGTGLGLSIVKHLMQLHGGRVRVESELGTGSRFTLEF